MAFLDFFFFFIKYYTDTSARNVVCGINEYLAETNERLRRIEARQKEAGIQLEEIDDFLQNSGNETAFIDALIALADTIGDFYFFTAADKSSPLFEQASMMWNRAKSAVEAAGLEIIDADNAVFDFRLHSAEGAEQDVDMPNGHVIRTLKFGYMYQDKVIRRAAVIINKIEKIDNKTGTTDNIIYL
jgi:molecular chaperone GrpE (heat shock protein)